MKISLRSRLQKTVNSLQEQLGEKEETIRKLGEELSKQPATITVALTKTFKTAEAAASPSENILTRLLMALAAVLAVVTITGAVIALRKRRVSELR
ncbi:hypothetical protein DRO64_02885 [Candidatus Bathyarchaeota archaeon]|nr:MAG: hypothetical protein DRO64_02885 [Candidatus Bathyarchaeota archaeon]